MADDAQAFVCEPVASAGDVFVLQSEVTSKVPRTRKRRTPGSFDLAKVSAAVWRIEPHVCRFCFGRVVSTALKPDGRHFRCTNCGAAGTSANSRAICACGMRLGERDAGIRCVVNVMPTPDNPSEIVAKEVK